MGGYVFFVYVVVGGYSGCVYFLVVMNYVFVDISYEFVWMYIFDF